MAFIKVTDRFCQTEIINTDMICTIWKVTNGYGVYFSDGEISKTVHFYDACEAKKIFDCIGVSLD